MFKKNPPLAQSPKGWLGSLFGYVMEWINEDSYAAGLRALAPLANERFLEIGFGTGRSIELLLRTPGVFVVGLDPTPTMVKRAQERLAAAGLSAQVDLREGSDDSIAWPEKEFDGVIAIHSFQFWRDPESTLRQIHRVLKPSGRVVLVFRNHSSKPPDWLPNPISKSPGEIEQTAELLQSCGFNAKEHDRAGTSRILRGDRIA